MTAPRRIAVALATAALALGMAACGHDAPTTAADQAPTPAATTPAATAPATSKSGSKANPKEPSKKSSGKKAGKSGNSGTSSGKTTGGGGSGSSKGDSSGNAPDGSYDDTTGTDQKPPKDQSPVIKALPGSAKTSTCTVVGNNNDVRNGDIAMGNFSVARKAFKKAPSVYEADESFFYVIPQSRKMSGVTVRLSSGKGKPIVVKADQVEEAAQWKYYPIHVQIPSSGTWTFTVTAGSAHGCFEATF